jgi:hypothetical protein
MANLKEGPFVEGFADNLKPYWKSVTRESTGDADARKSSEVYRDGKNIV